MKSQDTLNVICQVPAFSNKHMMQAFCDVINDADNTCRCNMMVKTGGSSLHQIGHIFHASRRDDLGVNAYSFQIRLNSNFITNFNVKPGSIPELEFKFTDTGLVTHVVLLNWSNHFAARLKRDV